MCGSQAATCIEEANSNHHGIDYSKKFETLFLNFKSRSHLRKPENHHKQKINKIFAPVFTGKIFCELLANINIKHKLRLGSVYFKRK